MFKLFLFFGQQVSICSKLKDRIQMIFDNLKYHLIKSVQALLQFRSDTIQVLYMDHILNLITNFRILDLH